ncbi:DUF4371 domain-containing protein [Trichonephila clavipes]|nr:DUF4371 domain-containing protein [Trichonephila clavipes]
MSEGGRKKLSGTQYKRKQLEKLAGILLNTKDYDLPSAMELFRNCKDFFNDLRSNGAFTEMLCDAKELADKIDILANFEVTQPRHRVRRKNVNFDYEARDDLVEDPTLKFKIKFYFFLLLTKQLMLKMQKKKAQ